MKPNFKLRFKTDINFLKPALITLNPFIKKSEFDLYDKISSENTILYDDIKSALGTPSLRCFVYSFIKDDFKNLIDKKRKIKKTDVLFLKKYLIKYRSVYFKNILLDGNESLKTQSQKELNTLSLYCLFLIAGI